MMRGRTLYVTVESPVWAQELALIGPDLVRRINQGVGAEVLREIRFRTGQIRHAMAWREAEERANADMYSQPLDCDELGFAQLERMDPGERRQALATKSADLIEDDDLRARFNKLLMLDARWQKWQNEHLSDGARRAAEILRREPWLSDDHVRSVEEGLSSDDLARARKKVTQEASDEVQALVGADALQSHEGRRRLKLAVESMAMLATECAPDGLTDDLILRACGAEYLGYVQEARGHGRENHLD